MLNEIGSTFSKLALSHGVGWHLEKETDRYGSYLMAEMRAKRNNEGVWATGYDFSASYGLKQDMKESVFQGILGKQGYMPTIRYWVTSFGKIHRPGCSFYERGRGSLASRPVGVNCRICGGVK